MSGSGPAAAAPLPLQFGNAALAALEGSPAQVWTQDCVYGPSHRHRLDVFAPQALRSGAQRSVCLFFYGGGWTSGAKANYAFIGTALARLGFTAAVADYRLHPEHRFPAYVEDAADALSWLSRHAPAFGGRSDRIIVAGHSAGAHLAMLLALDPRYRKAAGLGDAAIGGVVGLSGPYDFFPYPNDLCRDVFGEVEPARLAQPVTFAAGAGCPVILASGGRDEIVPAANSFSLEKALRSRGRACAHIHNPRVGHAAPLLALTRPFAGLMPRLRARLRRLQRDPPP